jgi:DNA ligase 1
MLLNAVVETSRAVAAPRSRKTKIEALAVTLRACEPDEIATVVNLLTGEPRQGRIGVGWETVNAHRNRQHL